MRFESTYRRIKPLQIMKKIACLTLISLTSAAFSFIQPPGLLVGQWHQKLEGNTNVRSIYRKDGTFDIFINGKTFVSGQYKVGQDTLSISDPVCGVGYYGAYRLNFITPDSVQFIPIQDSCRVRKASINQSPALSRLKTTKP
jgi:hypothetical protein